MIALIMQLNSDKSLKGFVKQVCLTEPFFYCILIIGSKNRTQYLILNTKEIVTKNSKKEIRKWH